MADAKSVWSWRRIVESGAWFLCSELCSGPNFLRYLASRADQRVLRWCGHMERMDEYRMARRMLIADVSGGRVRGRPRLGWKVGVKMALVSRGMTVEAAR